MLTMLQYLRLEILLYYYKQIRLGESIEKDVDNFYNTFLPLYFKAEENYGVEQESRVAKDLGISQLSDLTIRTIKNGTPKKIILLEDKRKEIETQDTAWADGLDQVTRYAFLVRREPGQNAASDILYLTVNIGTYIRFYELHPNESTARDFGPAEGQLLELADNEEEIHQLFTRLHDLTMH